jgi:hypothetical protein
MPTLRAVLASLPESALATLSEAAGLKRLDLDALERRGAGHIKVLLTDLPRNTLKDACRALGLDDSGREKVLLVDRLIQLEPAATSPVTQPSNTVPPGRTMARGKKQQKNGNGSALGFEATFWLAADKLRNNLDAAEYLAHTT